MTTNAIRSAGSLANSRGFGSLPTVEPGPGGITDSGHLHQGKDLDPRQLVGQHLGDRDLLHQQHDRSVQVARDLTSLVS